MMRLLKENYTGGKIEYGFDAFGNEVVAEDGFEIVPEGDVVKKEFMAFDIYSGWMETDNYHARNRLHALSEGRWTTWQKPTNE